MSDKSAGPTHTLADEWLELCFEVRPLRRPDGSICGISKIWTGREEVDVDEFDLEDTLIPLIEEAEKEREEQRISHENAMRELADKKPIRHRDVKGPAWMGKRETYDS